jgi:hypothetical protein
MERFDAIRGRWEELRLSKTQAAWLAVGSVGATLIIGFGAAGWVSGSSAEKRVAEAAANARQELAAAVCVEEFMAMPDAKAKLAKLSASGWYERGEMVAKGGWATMPDRSEPNGAVAAMCATQLSEKKI